MPINSYLQRSNRREQLLGLLKSREYWTCRELSRHLDISMRTLMRDLTELAAEGIPIETERGRGGGVRLHHTYGLRRLQLSDTEILDILVALAIMEKLPSPLLLKNVRSVRFKIARSFPESQRRQIETLRQRIWVGDKASTQVLAGFAHAKSEVLTVLTRALFEYRALNIKYTDEQCRRTQRDIEPHYLLLNWPVWYILAWDGLRDAARMFRIDRIRACHLLETRFKLLRKDKFETLTEGFFESI